MDTLNTITQTCADCGEVYVPRFCDVCNDATLPNWPARGFAGRRYTEPYTNINVGHEKFAVEELTPGDEVHGTA